MWDGRMDGGEVVVGANLGESVVGGADTGRRCRAERADYAYDGGLSSKKWKFLSQFNLENEDNGSFRIADGDMGHIVVKELGDRVLTHIFQGQKRGRQLRLQW